MANVEQRRPEPVGIILGSSSLRLWGLTTQERLRRSLTRAGIRRIATLADAPRAGGDGIVLYSSDWVFDEALVKSLVARPGVILVADDGRPVAAHVDAAVLDAAVAAIEAGNASLLPPGFNLLDAADLGGQYNNALRKREVPLLAKADPRAADELESRLFAGSYKGVTDIVTKYVWPVPARWVTKQCCRLGITPNQVTFASLLLVLGAFWAFWKDDYGLGLALAWAMTFLDTVDGKLARVTLTSTKFGNVFDHGIDLIHPPFWWWAWIVGLGHGYDPYGLLLGVVAGGYIIQRIEEGVFIRAFRIEMHMWQRFDSVFRLITARRNPNLLILTAATLMGEPDDGMIMVAIWTAICLLVHGLRLLQATEAARRGPLESWLAR